MSEDHEREDFALASRAFDLFTLAERERALVAFARLRYPSAIDRFCDAVHAVIVEMQAVAKDSASQSSGSQSVGGGVETKQQREDHLP